jgi:hypothetical protein
MGIEELLKGTGTFFGGYDAERRRVMRMLVVTVEVVVQLDRRVDYLAMVGRQALMFQHDLETQQSRIWHLVEVSSPELSSP